MPEEITESHFNMAHLFIYSCIKMARWNTAENIVMQSTAFYFYLSKKKKDK